MMSHATQEHLAEIQRNKWLFCHKPQPNAVKRLICFPYGGGGASIYRKWQQELGSSIEVCAMQPPGRENRSSEKPLDDIDAAIRQIEPLVEALSDKPLVLFGYSMGSVLAIATAQLLELQFNIIPDKLICCARSAPVSRFQSNRPELQTDAKFLDHVVSLGGINPEILDAPGMRTVALKLWKADFALSSSLDCTNSKEVACPIYTIGGKEDPTTSLCSLAAWGDLTSSTFELTMLHGDHFFMNTQESTIINKIR